MRRSSSKLVIRARSVRNIGKVPFKFKFDFLIESVEKLPASGDVVVVLERSTNKVDATKPAKIDRSTRKASFGKENLATDMTLFKNQPSERRFQDKVIKVAVKSNGIEGKTLGKIHLNLADYAEVPSGSKRISAELTNGATIIATIQCQFLSMGKASNGKTSGKADTPDGSAEEDDMEGDLEGDLMGSGNGEEVPSNFLKNKLRLSRVGSKKLISRRGREEEHHGEVNNGIDHAHADRLRKENMRLRKQLEEAERGGGGKFAAENKTLKNEVRELKSALAREPVYSDVVKELKEAKMALALLHLEKEKITLELMKFHRGEMTARR